MRFDRFNLPPTVIVNRAIEQLARMSSTMDLAPGKPDPVMAAADELARLLAHCLVRDVMDRAEAADEAEHAVERAEARLSARREALAQPIEQEPPPGARHALSDRTRRVLARRGIVHLWQLAARTEGEILRLNDVGRTTLTECRALLGGMGLSFGMGADPDVVALREYHDA